MSAPPAIRPDRTTRTTTTSLAAERWVLAAIGFGALLVAVSTAVAMPLPIDVVAEVAHLAGMLAGFAAIVMIALVSRVPWLERAVGADRLTRWHSIGGRWTVGTILVHAVFATLAVAGVTGGNAVMSLMTVMGLPGLLAATVGTILIITAGIASARAARRRLRYETWHLIHLMMYVGIALAFVHELAGPDLAGRLVEQLIWTLGYFAAFGLLLRYRVLEPVFSAAYHRLRVESVVQEAPGVTTITVSGRALDELGAESGQFFRWRFLTPRTWFAAHPFSLSAPPTATRLRLTVKDAGDGTARLAALPPKTRVIAEGPYGAMTDRRRRGNGVLLVAGGVGITPMRALFESLDTAGHPLTLLYRASAADQLVFRNELDAIARDRGAEVIYVVGGSADPATAITADRLRQVAPDLATRDVFICASPRFSSSVRTALSDAGVPTHRIHQEEFAF